MLFQRTIIIILNPCISCLIRQKQKSDSLAICSSDIFQAVNTGNDTRNGFWKEPLCLVMLAAHSGIYWKVEDYKTESKMYIDIE